MSNKKKTSKKWSSARILAVILAALMVVGVATLAITLIVSNHNAQGNENTTQDGSGNTNESGSGSSSGSGNSTGSGNGGSGSNNSGDDIVEDPFD